MKKFLIIGGECISLMKFRGELLKSIMINKYEYTLVQVEIVIKLKIGLKRKA